MSEFETFSEKLQPYQWMWRSCEIHAVAFRQSESWILAGLRIELSTAPTAVRIAKELLNCYILDVTLPVSQFNQIAYAVMNNGQLPALPLPSFVTQPMFLSQYHAGLIPAEWRLGWGSARISKETALRQYHLDFETITTIATLGQLNEILPPESRPKYEAALRRGEPAFDGLVGLRNSLLPGMILDEHHGGQACILAPISVAVSYDEELKINAPSGKPLDVRIFFNDGNFSPLVPLDLSITDPGIGAATIPIDWPMGSTEAKASLLTIDHHIMDFHFPRWPMAPTLRLALNTYFDEGHTELLEMLTSENSKKFEEGIVRLLGLLGLPMIWYTATKKGRRSDTGGICGLRDQNIALLVECTTEHSIKKFNPLRSRAQQLRKHLKGQCEVLPIVFVGCAIHDDEALAASTHGISLIGKQDIADLLEYLKANPFKPEDAYAFFRHMRQAPPFRSWFHPLQH